MRLITALLSAAMLPLAARAAFHSNDTACTRHYTVQDGDTCDKIGQKTLTSTYQILAFNLLNAGSACYTLEIGAQLCLGATETIASLFTNVQTRTRARVLPVHMASQHIDCRTTIQVSTATLSTRA